VNNAALNNYLAAIVKSLVEVGPNPNTIARMTGQKKESTRYRYYRFIRDRNLNVQAMPEYGKLGLRRIVSVVAFKAPYVERIDKVVSVLNEKAYAIGYHKQFMSDNYFLYFAAPAKYIEEIRNLLAKLEKAGVLEFKEFHEFKYALSPPMRADDYDFLAERWTFDFNRPSKPIKKRLVYTEEKFDRVDLLILKELMVDANTTFASMAKKLKVEYEKLVWHFNAHVKARQLIQTYRVSWIKSSYDSDADKATERFHSYVPMAFMIGDIKSREAEGLANTLESLPFLYFEALGEDGLFAVMYIPHEMYIDALRYLTPAVSACRSARQFVLDDTKALQYTFTYQLFDPESNAWTLDGSNALAAVLELVPKAPETAKAKPSLQHN
jgi:hypothetical protein